MFLSLLKIVIFFCGPINHLYFEQYAKKISELSCLWLQPCIAEIAFGVFKTSMPHKAQNRNPGKEFVTGLERMD